jgi:hypothetical protein
MESADLESAIFLCDRLAKTHPEWINSLRVDKPGDLPIVMLSIPHFPEHGLSIEVQRTEATVAYSDGLPPGPAERLPLERCRNRGSRAKEVAGPRRSRIRRGSSASELLGGHEGGIKRSPARMVDSQIRRSLRRELYLR